MDNVEAHRQRYEYLKAMVEHDNAFDALVASVPEEQQEIIDTLQKLRSPRPNSLLDPEKVERLKEEHGDVFTQVETYCMGYLKEHLGLE